MLTYNLVKDPDYLVSDPSLSTSSGEKDAAREAVPYYWVTAKNSDSVYREFERL